MHDMYVMHAHIDQFHFVYCIQANTVHGNILAVENFDEL